jgi:hypothetical protein
VQAPHLPKRKEYGLRRVYNNQYSPNDMPLNLSGEKRDRHEILEPKIKEYHTFNNEIVDCTIDHFQRRRNIKTYT